MKRVPALFLILSCLLCATASRQTAYVQGKAPHFEAEAVVDGEIVKLSLEAFKGKYLVLFFYPLDFTFVCPTEIIAFSDAIEQFKELDCNVAAVSVDSAFSHLAWTKVSRKEGGLGKMNIPLISDLSKQIARDYGVLHDESVALRGLFIIDQQQTIRQITINDLPVGRSVDETLRLVKAFQFSDLHGEVCPANWKPGEATIKPTPDASQEFFSQR
eukprot:TRINITY_DN9720_c0_g2_i1.p1 TRINITY_DN9720_c0_g2~~TRINITY_DN9720_c0_g2_i1.p1  ORF type:complete len:233 (-),score=60.17 TRINITY_DN9720_c0_g2_i1:17-661(-)